MTISVRIRAFRVWVWRNWDRLRIRVAYWWYVRYLKPNFWFWYNVFEANSIEASYDRYEGTDRHQR